MESVLILSRGGLPPLSARGCIQHLMPIESGMMRRTINGSLIYTGKAPTHKYRSIISCEDKTSLAIEGMWRGSEIRVGCIHRLWQKIYESEVILERDPVEGTVFIMTGIGQEREPREITGRRVIVGELIDKEAFVGYRPWLHMRVVTFSFMTNEWELKAGWQLELEEI